MNNKTPREAIIIRTSIIGIVTNLLLAGFKAVVGLLSNSIAIVLDAVNNLSDALSSVITIVGTVLASRAPDKKHPLGHGRIEYLSAMIISMIVLYAGAVSLWESVQKIIHPEEASYTTPTLIVVVVAIFVKVILGRYVKSVGEKTNSDSLIASGKDALFDALISCSVFFSAIVFITTHISLEAYVGVLISGFIIKAGIEMLLDTFDEILGKRMDRELIQSIKATVCLDPDVKAAYDLFLHSYGPERLIGSIHVEVSEEMKAPAIDAMSRRISKRVFEEHGILMTCIGIYSVNESNEEIRQIRSKVGDIVTSHEGVLQIHGFYIDPDTKEINLDVIIDYDFKERQALFEHISKELEEEFPDNKFNLVLDIDV